MDHRDHPAPHRGGHPAQGVALPTRFEWTRHPKVGPGLAVLGDLAGQTVVELGCGSGHNLAHLVGRHRAIGIGVDHDPIKIGRARAGYGCLPGIRFVLADCRGYLLSSTAPGSIDVCLSIFGAFSFTDDPRSLLAAVLQALRPGGLLALTLRADDHHDAVFALSRR